MIKKIKYVRWLLSVSFFSFFDRHVLLCLEQFVTYYAKHKRLKKKKKGKDASNRTLMFSAVVYSREIQDEEDENN